MVRVASLVLLLLLVGCKQQKLQRVSKCGQSCGTQSKYVGECKEGKWSCEDDESLVSCVGEVLPTKEVCDSKDNDCNGDVDDFVPPRCVTACGSFFQTCKNGSLACYSMPPKDEVCNGIDDNCDGVIDNPALLPLEFCYPGSATDLNAGECHPGKKKCEAGINVCKNFKLPTEEICDGLDNNCNGIVDESLDGCPKVTDLRVVLSWNINNDVDLHVKHQASGDSHDGGSWLVTPLDCYYANKTPSWDTASTEDNPILDRDVINGIGPETTIIAKPSVLHDYSIGVHMFNHSAAPNVVDTKVEVYCGGVLIATLMHSFSTANEMWVVGRITFDNNAQCMFNPDGYIFTK